ncbi:MAG: CPBP family glutamic-type intramembrane protease [Candidatus Odinarchaeia archaeon]
MMFDKFINSTRKGYRGMSTARRETVILDSVSVFFVVLATFFFVFSITFIMIDMQFAVKAIAEIAILLVGLVMLVSFRLVDVKIFADFEQLEKIGYNVIICIAIVMVIQIAIIGSGQFLGYSGITSFTQSPVAYRLFVMGAAVSEEFFFNAIFLFMVYLFTSGYMVQASQGQVIIAALARGLSFGMFHLVVYGVQLSVIIALSISGFVLSYFVWRTKYFSTSIVAHVMTNLFAAIMGG